MLSHNPVGRYVINNLGLTTACLLLLALAHTDESVVARNLSSIRRSAKTVSSRQLLNKPDSPNVEQSLAYLDISIADKYMHELKAWALKTLKRQHRQYVRAEMRSILRNTYRGYAAMSPANITRMLLPHTNVCNANKD